MCRGGGWGGREELELTQSVTPARDDNFKQF